MKRHNDKVRGLQRCRGESGHDCFGQGGQGRLLRWYHLREACSGQRSGSAGAPSWCEVCVSGAVDEGTDAGMRDERDCLCAALWSTISLGVIRQEDPGGLPSGAGM